MFTINVIMTVIDEFQQLNLFVFELLFYVIGDMSVKSIIKFVVFLASLLKKSINYLKNVIFLYNFGLLLREMRPFFRGKFFIWFEALGLGLEPALISHHTNPRLHVHIPTTTHFILQKFDTFKLE